MSATIEKEKRAHQEVTTFLKKNYVQLTEKVN